MNGDHDLAKHATDQVPDVAGIVRGYEDTSRVWCETQPETRTALLLAMGLDPSRPQLPPVPAVKILWPDQLLAVGGPAELVLEDGTVLQVRSSTLPDLPVGYHTLRLLEDGSETWLIRRPDSCWLPPGLRSWGWAVQLYAALSRGSWGHGDLEDLRRLARWMRESGADVVLLNPLCATSPVPPVQASPYYPSSRRFRNPLYVSVDAIPGASQLGDQLPQLAAAGRQLNEIREIDRDAVFAVKLRALEQLWARGVADADGLDEFGQLSGHSLDIFATFCVLAERWGADWRQWPAEYRDPAGQAVARFARDHADRIRFHKWLQWLLDRQLARAAAELPLVHDLPIGVDPGGADAWQWQDVLAHGVTVGAPPDQFNAGGQDWSLPPFIPHRLRAARFRPFIETIRSSLRHAGGLRIDHVMGLFRLYWIPESFGPRRGTYVRYPADELLAIVAVESHRARAWIAGEDLGTVEDGVRQKLADNQMLSYRVMWFEDELPEAYPQHTLAAISTHDLPTVAGLWSGADFAAQAAIGLEPSREGYQEIRRRLVAATGLDEQASPETAVRAAYAALGRASSAVLVANLEDALAVHQRPNMPGTIDQWPNWSLPLPAPIETLADAELPAAISRVLTQRPDGANGDSQS
jgi:4-alpha-glucanotransferase